MQLGGSSGGGEDDQPVSARTRGRLAGAAATFNTTAHMSKSDNVLQAPTALGARKGISAVPSLPSLPSRSASTSALRKGVTKSHAKLPRAPRLVRIDAKGTSAAPAAGSRSEADLARKATLKRLNDTVVSNRMKDSATITAAEVEASRQRALRRAQQASSVMGGPECGPLASTVALLRTERTRTRTLGDAALQ